MRDRIKKALAFDPLNEAEKQTGKSYKTDNDTTMLGFELMQRNTQEINSLLKRCDDTIFSHSVDDYLRIVSDIGFETLVHFYFESENEKSNQYFLFFHRELAILMVTDTYTILEDETINRSDMYFNWRPNSDNRDGTSSGHFHGFSYDKKESIWIGHNDSRLALRTQIEELKEHGTFVTPWIEQPFLYLVHHGDKNSKIPAVDGCNPITKARIECLPEDVIAVISPN